MGCHDQVGAKKFAKSTHAPLSCTDCHSDVTAVPHEKTPVKPTCETCHADAVAAWNNSLHAKAVKDGSARGAKCADCHGGAHEVTKLERSDIPKKCSSCHAQQFVMDKAGLSPQPAMSYSQSVHGRAVANGSTKAAVCTDCHDHHDVRAGNDPQSGIFKFNVGRTCSRCHAAVAGQYSTGVHAKALAHGNWNAPTCTSCHGIHTIAKTNDPVRGPRASCLHCHEGVRLSEEFAVAKNRVSTYQQSYHGLARRGGSKVAADCASCHGAHEILPSSDPRSAIHPNNLVKTCGKCHEGTQENFARGKVHLTADDVSDKPAMANTWIRRIYIGLIAGTIGFMVLHNLLAWVFKVREARRRRGAVVTRMNRNQRLQHLIFVISFFVLVITGFALAWPDSILGSIFGESPRRIIHRVAGVIMIIVGLYHLGYMTFTAEGRKGLRDFWIRIKDATDLLTTLRYYLGLSKERPQYARFNYAEKMEYWAGMWGTIVMAITGLVIWYFVEVATWIPRWWIDIATTIHFWEAVLATASIVVWHLYQVIFDPDIYPMNFSWYDGKMSDKLYHHEHGLDPEPPAVEEREDA